MSFKLKLILSYIVILLVSFGSVAFFLDKNLEEDSLREIKASLVTEAALITEQISPESVKAEDITGLETQAKKISAKAACRITIVDARGQVLADSEKNEGSIPGMESHANRPEIKSALSDRTGIDIRYSSTLNKNMLYVALPIKYQNQTIGALRLALGLANVEMILAKTRHTVFAGVIFAIALAVILGLVIAHQMMKPVNGMISISRLFASGDFSRRIVSMPKDELGQLAVTLNKMAGDIEGKIKEIQNQNQHMSAIFNSMVEGVIVIDKTGRVVSINPTVEKIFGISRSGVEGRYFLEVIRNNDMAEVIAKSLKTGESLSGEVNLLMPIRKIFQISASPVFENSQVSGCLIVIHDVTEIRKLETMRRDFVANVSHELKTPLTSIKGFVETLLDGAIDDKENSRQFLSIIQHHTDRLSSLIDDLLALSHIESKEVALEKEKFKLRDHVDEIALGFKTQLKKRSILIRNEIPSDLSIDADRARMGQVLINIIDNAIKFNKEKGFVSIAAREEGDNIEVIIEDSGIGIPENDVPRIFERFYRVDKARSRELGGTGLGLSIVKHIIDLHGGTIRVESVEGLGSKFRITLPK